MYEKLYPYMQWPQIEALVYSEHNRPHNILGQHLTDDGLLITAFMPTAESAAVEDTHTKTVYPMEKMDDGGYFAVMIESQKKITYKYHVIYDNGDKAVIYDPYAFENIIDSDEIQKFNAGINYEIYKVLGAHPKKLDGVSGVLFAVWAPEAVRVSVVGDFNQWDGRRHPMECLGESGIHELFIPGLKELDKYKYEIKVKHNNTVMLKADPYGTWSELRPDTASVVYDISKYKWNDSTWLKQRAKKVSEEEPMAVYEVHLGGFKRPEADEDKLFYNYREMAVMIADYVKKMGYTHVELMPVMEHPLDESWGYQVTGYYAPTSRYGTPEDFMAMIDHFHQNGIGVILDWVPAHFPRDIFGLAAFDGSCVYEHKDPRQGSHPHWGTLIFNYGRPEVSNFLIANALYWVEQFHADGIRMDAVASMLYLDYGKKDGEWIPNIYGGKENLEAIEMLKHLNSIMAKRNKGVLMIAEESTAWPNVTKSVEEDGLGFNYKWNMGWMNDFLNFMQLDPLFRKYHYNELLFSMIYAYSEHFILVLSHDEVVHGKGSMIGKMPGEYDEKFSNLRLAYGYMLGHPGKKLLFMGQDYAQFTEFNEGKSLEWFMLENERHQQMQDYVKALNNLYTTYPALTKYDDYPEGFEWINCMSAEETLVSFIRKTDKDDETLLFVCNFTPVVREKYKIGVPFRGKFKEIFNSDAKEFGGEGHVNPRLKQSKEDECDGRDDSITITVPPLGVSIFTCTKLLPAKNAKKGAAKTTAKRKVRKIENVQTEEKKIAEGKKTASVKAKAKTEAMKTETVKAEAVKAETVKTEAVKAETVKAEAMKTETAKTETGKLKTVKTDSVKEIPVKKNSSKTAAKKAGKKTKA